jgi:hypothetical protein
MLDACKRPTHELFVGRRVEPRIRRGLPSARGPILMRFSGVTIGPNPPPNDASAELVSWLSLERPSLGIAPPVYVFDTAKRSALGMLIPETSR